MVSKNILSQYEDLEKEIKEVRQKIDKIEKEIQKIEETGTVADTVKGGLGGIQHYKIEGFPYPQYSRKKILLNNRKSILSELELELMETLNEVEAFIKGIDDSHIRRIVSLRFVDGLTWEQVAIRIGGGNNEGSVKMAFQRFMQKQ